MPPDGVNHQLPSGMVAREFGEAETRTTVVLRDRQAIPSEVLARRPDLRRMSGSVLQRRAGRCAAVQAVQLPDCRIGQVSVFLGDGKG